MPKFLRVQTAEASGYRKFLIRLDSITHLEFLSNATTIHVEGGDKVAVSLELGQKICQLLEADETSSEMTA